MLYLIHGTDSKKTREKLHELLKILETKKPNAAVFSITSENWSESQLEEFIQSQGLFEQKYIVVLDSLFGDKKIAGELKEKIKDLKNSENVFIALDGSIDAKTKASLEKNAEKAWLLDEKESKPKKEFNVFALTDALGARDKAKLWALYQEALMNGSEPEELHGLLYWQIKNLLLVKNAKSASETNLKPFVFQKAQSFSKFYTEQELQKLSSTFVDVYHKARRGVGEFDALLERAILEI